MPTPIHLILQVSYAKGVDWYLMTSFFFIFLALAECVLVEKMMNKSAEARPQPKDEPVSPEQVGSRKTIGRVENATWCQLVTCTWERGW